MWSWLWRIGLQPECSRLRPVKNMNDFAQGVLNPFEPAIRQVSLKMPARIITRSTSRTHEFGQGNTHLDHHPLFLRHRDQVPVGDVSFRPSPDFEKRCLKVLRDHELRDWLFFFVHENSPRYFPHSTHCLLFCNLLNSPRSTCHAPIPVSRFTFGALLRVTVLLRVFRKPLMSTFITVRQPLLNPTHFVCDIITVTTSRQWKSEIVTLFFCFSKLMRKE